MRSLISFVLAMTRTTLSAGQIAVAELLCQLQNLVLIAVGQLAGRVDPGAELARLLLHELQQLRAKIVDLVDGDLLHHVPQRRDQDDNLLMLAEGMVLPLAQQAHQALSVDQLALRLVVEVAGKLRKDLHLTVLRQIQTQRAGGGFHGLRLRVAADTGHGQAHVHGGGLSRGEKKNF